MVEDEHGVQDLSDAGEAAVVPGARDYVIERTLAGIAKAHERAVENGWPMAPVESLRAELLEVSA